MLDYLDCTNWVEFPMDQRPLTFGIKREKWNNPVEPKHFGKAIRFQGWITSSGETIGQGTQPPSQVKNAGTGGDVFHN